MELVNHSLILANQPVLTAADSGRGEAVAIATRQPEVMESVDMILIKSGTNQLTHNTGHVNGNNVESHAHILINRDGLVSQFIPFNEKIAHPIDGSWDGTGDLASRSVTIMFENYGRLSKRGEEFVSACGQVIGTSDVFTGIHQNEESLSYWQKFTDSQVQLAEKIIRCLSSTYQVKYILGYEEVCPGLQTDPGPAFPLEIMRRKIMKGSFINQSESQGMINITEQVDLSSIINSQHIDENQKKDAKIVNIRRKSGGWYKVNIDLGGFIKEEWVSI